jgi:hypothetical protein
MVGNCQPPVSCGHQMAEHSGAIHTHMEPETVAIITFIAAVIYGLIVYSKVSKMS